MSSKWVTVRNDGDGPIMLGERYLEKGESREVPEAHLETAKQNHPDHAKWLHVVSRRTIKDGEPLPDPLGVATPIAPSQADIEAQRAAELKKEQPKMKETIDPPTQGLPDDSTG